MSQKKCPKCGEMNPPEAVMCWACYTPLNGGAATAPSSAPTSGPMIIEGGEGAIKKPVSPAQIGAVLAVLVVLGFGAKMFLGGGSGDEEPSGPPTVPQGGGGGGGEAPQPPTGAVPPVPVVSANPPPGLEVPPPSTPPPYVVVAAPNPSYSVGTMAIALNNPGVTSRQAAAYAVSIRQQMMQNRAWVTLQIYVFTTKEAGLKFRQFQKQRKGAPLGTNDLASLAPLWPQAIVRYEYNRGAEGILLPSRNPTSWWTGRTIYTRVKQ